MTDLHVQIARIIENHYLFKDQASALANTIRQHTTIANEPEAIATEITDLLVNSTNDKHFLLRYAPDEASGNQDHAALMQEHTERSRQQNFGFDSIRRLDGNIGHVVLTELPPVFIAEEMVSAVVTLIKNMNGLILDLRQCGGGSADMVQYIASIFLEPNLGLSGIESPKSGLHPVETLSEMSTERLLHMPLYILISDQTFSAAEALAYDLQAHGRAIIVGQRSRGGAHLSDFFPIDDQWILRLPVARALNPITNSNWEATGIIPDVETDTPLESALKLAQK